MVTLVEAFVWFLIILLSITAHWYLTVPKNLPPGPIGLPILGSTLRYWNGAKQPQLLQEDVKKYGPLFKLYIANRLVVVLGDFDTIQEATVKQGDVFLGRPQMLGMIPKNYYHRGVAFAEGDLWKEQRRFALSTLRDLGVSRPIMEPRIKEELEYLIQKISDYTSSGKAIDPQIYVTCAVSNIINAIIFGRRFSYDDSEFVQQFMGLSKRNSASGVGVLTPFILVEKVAALCQLVPYVRGMIQETNDFAKFVERETKKTKATFDPDADPTNYIHAFMKASRETQGDYFDDNQLAATVYDLFTGGSETTATTSRWAILFLAKHPDIQEHMYQEIKDQVGVSALPDYADRTKLPFAEAVVMETQRLANLVPLGGLRRSVRPTKLMGYDIPEDTLVLPFLTNVLHNPELYPNPTKFDPYRFLDNNNGKVYRDPKLIPFQAGKRVCLGEPLARMELFLLLAGLVSRFQFYFSENQSSITLKPVIGITCTPTPYEVHVALRND